MERFLSMTHPFQFIPSGTGTPLVSGITCKVSSASTGGAYTIIELSLPPNGGAPQHTHSLEDEIFHVMDGVCEIICGGKTYLAEVGSVVVLPKNVPHAFRNPSDTPNRILITAIPGGLDTYFEALAQISGDDPDAPQKVASINARYQINFDVG
jgi:quercetin dioxygenase-like cupin family protein